MTGDKPTYRSETHSFIRVHAFTKVTDTNLNGDTRFT